MKKGKNRDVRLLPAVIGVAAILLALKAGGLAFSANAQTPAPAAAPKPAAQMTQAAGAAKADPTAAINAALPLPKVDPNAAAAAPAGDASTALAGAGVTPAQMDVLTSLADRRDALDDRQRQLDLQANLLSATEKRVDGKIGELKALQTKIEALLDQRDAQDAAQLDSLVKIYTAMKPKDAARIFEKLDDQVRLSVAGHLKADIIAGILSALPSDVAQKLTVQLANHNHAVDPAAVASALATATPAAAPAPNAAATPAPAGARTASGG